MVDLFSTYRIYFVAATLGAHSNFQETGFRQKDVRFLLGLFLNWMDSTTKNVDEQIHNTQILRFLDELIRQGYAKKINRGRTPLYQLTRPGLLDLVGRISKGPVGAPLEQFIFIFYFIHNYGTRLKDLVSQKEAQLPKSYQLELESLLDTKELLTQQIRYVELEIRKLEVRSQETQAAARLAKDLSKKGVSADEMVRSVEQMFPYDLNNQKPMSELFAEIPPSLRAWELTIGNQNRVDFLWSSLKTYLAGYLSVLKQMHSKQSDS